MLQGFAEFQSGGHTAGGGVEGAGPEDSSSLGGLASLGGELDSLTGRYLLRSQEIRPFIKIFKDPASIGRNWIIGKGRK